MTKKEYYRHIEKRCECGALVYGHSEKHTKANIKLHKKSRRHKEFMEIKELNKKERGK